ncbi:hypothetical protein [Leisingera caerulea]|uniref:hypothetical protein n=1 Tax=Leisingera caerulea TaxID=506591 RepID=UPI0012B53151|nr:hypothetical protein [Leisingera caerulea]
MLSFLCVSTAAAQDIGLSVQNDGYLSLTRVETNAPGFSEYVGHVTTYDPQKGFFHFPVNGKIDRSNRTLSVVTEDHDLPKDFSSAYNLRKLDSNSAWQKADFCQNCYDSLIGTTLKADQDAVELLNYYGRNRDERGMRFQDYVGAMEINSHLCRIGFLELCQESSEVGIVMEQSLVPAAKLVARSQNAETSVATFSTSQFDGAMLVTSPSVLKAVAEAVGPSLRDGTLDFSSWKVVSRSPAYRPINFHNLQLEMNEQDNFFGEILKNPEDVKNINSRMKTFFGVLAGPDELCKYSYYGGRPTWDCFLHSDDMKFGRYPVWLRVFCFISISDRGGRLIADLTFSFTRKFDRKSSGPAYEKFSPIKHGDGTERELAVRATEYVAQTLEEHFGFKAMVRR